MTAEVTPLSNKRQLYQLGTGMSVHLTAVAKLTDKFISRCGKGEVSVTSGERGQLANRSCG